MGFLFDPTKEKIGYGEVTPVCRPNKKIKAFLCILNLESTVKKLSEFTALLR